MPSLVESVREPGSFEYVPGPGYDTDVLPPSVAMPDATYSIRSNVYLRSPAPPINVSPDNLRQFYRGGQVPQYRTLSPSSLPQQAFVATAVGGATTAVAATTTTASTSSTATSPTGQQAGITTPTLQVGQNYAAVISIAKAFDILKFQASTQARVRMYKTLAFQQADLSRPVTQPVALGVQGGIICDMWFQQLSELNFNCSPDIPGSNGDAPQTPIVYITVTNMGVSSGPVSISLLFVPWES